MTIETKLNIDDKAYVLWDNKVEQILVTRIIISIGLDLKPEEIYSCLFEGSVYSSIEGNKIFKTKEELLKSL